MDAKTLHVLEYPKILERLKGFCDFSASMELARKLFSVQDIGIGGVSTPIGGKLHISQTPVPVQWTLCNIAFALAGNAMVAYLLKALPSKLFQKPSL